MFDNSKVVFLWCGYYFSIHHYGGGLRPPPLHWGLAAFGGPSSQWDPHTQWRPLFNYAFDADCCSDMCSGVSARRLSATGAVRLLPAVRPPAVPPPGPHGPAGSMPPWALIGHMGPMKSPGSIFFLYTRQVPAGTWAPLAHPANWNNNNVRGSIIWSPSASI